MLVIAIGRLGSYVVSWATISWVDFDFTSWRW